MSATGEPESEPEPELEALLRRVPPERPAAARREEARRAFLGQESRASRAREVARMGNVTDVDELAFEAWLSHRRVLQPAGEAARRRARLAFLSMLAAQPVQLRRRSPAVRALVLTLAAAAIVAVTFLLPRPDRWRVRLTGPLRFAEEEFSPGDDDRLAVALESSGRLEAGQTRARFTLGSALDVELLPGASVEFPALPELDGASPVDFEVASGEAYVRTRAGYPGNPIQIRTPLATVALHGTTVGVLVDQDCVCVCVANGTASVSSPRIPGGERDVGARSSLLVFEGAEMKLHDFPKDPSAEEHTRGLVEFGEEP